MEASKIIISVILFIIAIGSFVISYLQFNERGFLFNNAYLYASKEEREKMNKKPHFRQSGIVFILIGIIFLLNSIEVILESVFILYAVFTVTLIAIIYAIVSSVKIEAKNKVK